MCSIVLAGPYPRMYVMYIPISHIKSIYKMVGENRITVV